MKDTKCGSSPCTFNCKKAEVGRRTIPSHHAGAASLGTLLFLSGYWYWYYKVQTLDPGFVPGADPSHARRYWLALEKLGKARGSPDRHASHLADRLSFLRAQVSLTGTPAIELEALLRPGDGIETILSADVYGEGAADELLGRAIAGADRDSLCLVGAVGHDFYDGERDGNQRV